VRTQALPFNHSLTLDRKRSFEMDKKLIVFVVFALLISSIWLLIYLHGKAEERNSSLTVEQWIDAGKEMFYVKLNAEIQ
jgi:hypothetical protein